MCLCLVSLKRGISTVGAENAKQYLENVQSSVIDGSLSDRPDREHDNLAKLDRTCDDVGKNLANAIVAKFWLWGRFPSIPSILWQIHL